MESAHRSPHGSGAQKRRASHHCSTGAEERADAQGHDAGEARRRRGPRGWLFGSFLGRWFVANAFLSGLFALLWLLFRSGAKPTRIVYPCQRAAIGTATAAFGAPVVAAVIAARRRAVAWMGSPVLVTAAILGLCLTASLWIVLSRADDARLPALDPPADYRAQLFHVSDCPQDPGGDHFVGWSNLVGVMGRGGLKLYRSATESAVSGPDGVLAPDDVVVIKINYQWDQRGGTNTDLLRGMIRSIVDHPDGFAGEVIVCENAQFNAVSNFDRALNNAQDHSLSPHDVVVGFQALGYNVSHYDWTLKRAIQVSEYAEGDLTDGYIVGTYDALWHGKLSSPKFRSAAGTYISLRYGTWDPASQTYDREHLKFINVPVLKSHHATYGATVSTKHYMGVVTDQFSTNSHAGIRYGIMGALMDEIQLADLNVVDAIWINANPYSGPQTSYTGATRRDELVACLDPIALDIWSVKNILIPGFLSNGYTPPWPNPSADPDIPTSAFRTYLDNSMNILLGFGHAVTNDYGRIDVTNASGASGDFDRNGSVDLYDYGEFAACFTGPGGGPVEPECVAADFDADGDVDCDDWDMFRYVWTAADDPPSLPQCALAGVEEIASGSSVTRVALPAPNPSHRGTRIAFSVATSGSGTLAIHDVGGRVIRTLAAGDMRAGDHALSWDGRDADGRDVPRGVYTVVLRAAGVERAAKIVVR